MIAVAGVMVEAVMTVVVSIVLMLMVMSGSTRGRNRFGDSYICCCKNR